MQSEFDSIMPFLLPCRPETIKAKFDFLVNHMHLTTDDVVSFPHYFGYSLERRIQPRFERIQALGASSALASMLCCSDIAFEKKWPAVDADTDSSGADGGGGGGRVKGARARVSKEPSHV